MSKNIEFLAIVWELLRFGRRTTPKDWWKRKPFLPIPPKDYIQLRLQTMYGKDYKPTFLELLKDTYHFGRWLKNMRRHYE